MPDVVVKTVVSPDGECRVVITRRECGGYSAQRQWRQTPAVGEEWEPLSLFLGFYDSPETAEFEAFAIPRWRPTN